MSEPLTGRVSTYQSGNETLFLIRSKKDWTILLVAIWLAFWATVPLPVVRRALGSLHHDRTQIFGLLWTVSWVVGLIFGSWSIFWRLGGKEILRLSPSELEVTAKIVGIPFRRRSTPLSEVRNLRYVPAFSQGRNSRESGIRFEDAKGTAKFGAGLEDWEALALIERLLLIYPFPKRDKSVEYIDLGG